MLARFNRSCVASAVSVAVEVGVGVDPIIHGPELHRRLRAGAVRVHPLADPTVGHVVGEVSTTVFNRVSVLDRRRCHPQQQ
jgi:hypothetical protein